MTEMAKSLHSICKWTFHAGKGGFIPADIRTQWRADKFGTVEMIHLVRDRIAPRLPAHIGLGIELHYSNEIDEENAEAVAEALVETGLVLAMITPGAHIWWGYGGIASLDPKEREESDAFGRRTVDLAYGPLRKTWHSEDALAPSLVLWNGSWGYDLHTPQVREMLEKLLESLAGLCRYEANKGGKLFKAIEPKPNEGHPRMLVPTVASALLCIAQLRDAYGVDVQRAGVNMELGHSEMIGLDTVHDIAEQLVFHGAIPHLHLNSQGGNDGVTLGGPGLFDIDHGYKITGAGIAIARLLQDAGYQRWVGHDMQPRAYDDEEQAIDRVIRSILSWEASLQAARSLDMAKITDYMQLRQTAKVEDIMCEALIQAHNAFKKMYQDAQS